MTDEVHTTEQPAPSPAEERINQLSDKVKNEAIRADTALAEKAEAEKRAVFAEGYAEIVGQYPAAKEFKADIQAKVASGYSVEDAALAVLGKAGKLGITQGPIVQPSPAGGSASTALPQDGGKTVGEMSMEEKRQALIDSGLSPTEMFSPFRGN